MNAGWDGYAEDWDRNKDVIAYAENAFALLTEIIDIKGLRILDFGCGTGLLSEKCSPMAKEIVALDTSSKMASVLVKKNLPNVTTISDELTSLLVSQHSCFSVPFDLILASSVCGFLPDFSKTLKLLKSLLVLDGTFVQWDWLADDHDEDFGLSNDLILTTYHNVGLTTKSIGLAFSMQTDEGEMSVVMGVAKNESETQLE